MLRRVAITSRGVIGSALCVLEGGLDRRRCKARNMQVLCGHLFTEQPCNGPGASVRVLGCGVPGCTPFWSGGEYLSMPASESEVLVGRRYLERGFLDAAMRLFVRNAELVTAADWAGLAELPLERMLVAADASLRRKDVDGAMRLYELAGADRERWAKLVDVLTAIPDRERQAIEIVDRHLGGEAQPEPPLR